MTGLIADLVVGLVSTFIGVLLGLLTYEAQQRRTRRQLDLQTLQALVEALAGKRAFRTTGITSPMPVDEVDLQRCTGSVLDTRSRVVETMGRLSSGSSAVVDCLRTMEADCLSWLDFTNVRPDLYVASLDALSSRLQAAEERLAKDVPRLKVVPPGSRGRDLPAWLHGLRSEN